MASQEVFSAQRQVSDEEKQAIALLETIPDVPQQIQPLLLILKCQWHWNAAALLVG
jgi:hypothetical protein